MRLRASGNIVYLPVKICTGETRYTKAANSRFPALHQRNAYMPWLVLHNFQAGHILFNRNSWPVLFNAARLILCSLQPGCLYTE